MKKEETFIYNIFTGESVKIGDIITFTDCCNADRETFMGVVSYIDQLGFVVVIKGKIYEVRKLIDIKKINKMKGKVKLTNVYTGQSINIITELVENEHNEYVFTFETLSDRQRRKIEYYFGKFNAYYTKHEIIKIYGKKP